MSEPQTIHVSPAMAAGIVSPSGEKRVSPEAQDVLDRLKAYYQGLGKPSAAANYGRHLKSFFAWAEQRGYGIRSLPSDAVEAFLADLSNAGQKESTIYVMRTQLKGALRECHNSLGIDFAHLEYQTGKPREVRRAQKEREKQKRHEKRAAQTIAQAQAIMAANGIMAPVQTPTPLPANYRAQVIPFSSSTSTYIDQTPTLREPAMAVELPEELPMSTQSAPDLSGVPMNGASQTGQQPVVVVQMPPQQTVSPARPTNTIGNAQKPAGTPAQSAVRGLAINSHTFTGPYIRISRMADGTEPLVPPGTESYVTTLPLSQLAPHGDVAAFLQSFIMPNLRLSPMVSQVQFVFHELNDRRQPTGRRDELVVGLPMTTQPGPQAAPQAPTFHGLAGFSNGTQAPVSGGVDSSTAYLLRKLDDEAAESKKRAEDYQQQLREAKDAQTTFLLMQQFQKEQDLRRELEERRRMEIDRMNAPPPMPMQMLPPPPPMVEVLPKEDASAAIAKAFSEQQTRMMEIMLAGMANNKPAAPTPQKDAAEWLVPFMSQMNAQAIQQQQANQQMLVGIMQSNQQFMQALLTRENPTEKLLLAQMQEVKAAANAPKADEMEAFADKLQKMKMVSDMLGGGGGGPSSLFGELLANAESIGEGAAKIIAAANGAKAPAPQLAGIPQRAVQQQALPAARATGAQAPAAENAAPTPPEAAIVALDAIIAGATQDNDQAVVENVIGLIGALSEGPEPFPRMAQRLLNALKDIDDEAELFTLAKSLYIVCGRKADKAVSKKVAAILAKWYTEIHQQVFGEPKSLGDEEVGETEIDSEEEELEAADGETAEVA